MVPDEKATRDKLHFWLSGVLAVFFFVFCEKEKYISSSTVIIT